MPYGPPLYGIFWGHIFCKYGGWGWSEWFSTITGNSEISRVSQLQVRELKCSGSIKCLELYSSHKGWKLFSERGPQAALTQHIRPCSTHERCIAGLPLSFQTWKPGKVATLGSRLKKVQWTLCFAGFFLALIFLTFFGKREAQPPKYKDF